MCLNLKNTFPFKAFKLPAGATMNQMRDAMTCLLYGEFGPIVDVESLGGALEQPVQPIWEAVEERSLEQNRIIGFRAVRVEAYEGAALAVELRCSGGRWSVFQLFLLKINTILRLCIERQILFHVM